MVELAVGDAKAITDFAEAFGLGNREKSIATHWVQQEKPFA